MMKKVIAAFIVATSVLTYSCDNRTPQQKSDDLLEKSAVSYEKYIVYHNVEQLDSALTYAVEAHGIVQTPHSVSMVLGPIVDKNGINAGISFMETVNPEVYNARHSYVIVMNNLKYEKAMQEGNKDAMVQTVREIIDVTKEYVDRYPADSARAAMSRPMSFQTSSDYHVAYENMIMHQLLLMEHNKRIPYIDSIQQATNGNEERFNWLRSLVENLE